MGAMAMLHGKPDGRRSGRPRFARYAFVLLAAALLLACAHFGLTWNDPASVKSLLEASPRARDVEVWGNDEEVLGATIHVDGDPAKLVSLNTPGRWGLRTGTRMLLEGVGPYGFLVVSDGWGWNAQIDVGRGGEFENFLPVRVRNARDLIDRYEEVVGAIAKVPRAGIYRGASGRTYSYRIGTEADARDSQWYEQMIRESRAAASSPAADRSVAN